MLARTGCWHQKPLRSFADELNIIVTAARCNDAELCTTSFYDIEKNVSPAGLSCP